MSSIDLSNPQVLKNWLTSQMQEGKGEFITKEKVLVFRMKDGSEYICPSELVKEKGVEPTVAAPAETAPSVEPQVLLEESVKEEKKAKSKAGKESVN